MKRLLPAFAFIAALATCLTALAAINVFQIDTLGTNASALMRNAPGYVDARVLAANTSEAHTIPTGANRVIFSSNCAAFYAIIGGTAAVPAADVTDGSGSELNPSAWAIPGTATQIAVISPTTCIVTMAFYK